MSDEALDHLKGVTGIRVLVCGGRKYYDRTRLYGELDRIHGMGGPEGYIGVLIHGACQGADLLAESWARDRQVPYLGLPAKWKREGKAAGYVRNKAMLDLGMPDIVVAFPGGKGTAQMVKIARKADIPVLEIDPPSQFTVTNNTIDQWVIP